MSMHDCLFVAYYIFRTLTYSLSCLSFPPLTLHPLSPVFFSLTFDVMLHLYCMHILYVDWHFPLLHWFFFWLRAQCKKATLYVCFYPSLKKVCSFVVWLTLLWGKFTWWGWFTALVLSNMPYTYWVIYLNICV